MNRFLGLRIWSIVIFALLGIACEGEPNEPCPMCPGVVVGYEIVSPPVVSVQCPTGFVVQGTTADGWDGPYPDVLAPIWALALSEFLGGAILLPFLVGAVFLIGAIQLDRQNGRTKLSKHMLD